MLTRLAPVAALTLAAGLIAPAPAHATLRETAAMAVAQVGSTNSGCTVSAPGPVSQRIEFTDNGRWATASASRTGTIVEDAQPADTSTARSSSVSRVLVRSSGGTFDHAETRATVRASVDAALGTGTSCDPFATGDAWSLFTFSVGSAGWIDVDLLVRSTGLVEQNGFVEVIRVQQGNEPVARLTSSNYPATMTVFLEPGSYTFTSSTDAFASEYGGTSSAELSAVADFTAAGSASSGTKGPGRRYLSLPAGRDCAGDRVEARLTKQRKALKQVERITLRAPGARTTTVRTPVRGAPVVVRSVPERRAVTVSAVVRLKSGKKLPVSRSYLTCR